MAWRLFRHCICGKHASLNFEWCFLYSNSNRILSLSSSLSSLGLLPSSLLLFLLLLLTLSSLLSYSLIMLLVHTYVLHIHAYCVYLAAHSCLSPSTVMRRSIYSLQLGLIVLIQEQHHFGFFPRPGFLWILSGKAFRKRLSKQHIKERNQLGFSKQTFIAAMLWFLHVIKYSLDVFVDLNYRRCRAFGSFL